MDERREEITQPIEALSNDQSPEVSSQAEQETMQEADPQAKREAENESVKEEKKVTKEAKREAKERTKKEPKKGRCIAFGVLTFLFLLSAVSAILYLGTYCIITDDGRIGTSNYVTIMNPFDETASSYRGTRQFDDNFYRDVTAISGGLARSVLVESMGEYDADKSFDIISYYYRRHLGRIPEPYDDLKIEYRLADLIAWSEMGIDYETISEWEWNERFPQYSTGRARSDAEGEGKLFTVIQERFLPKDGVSLYERSYPDAEAIFSTSGEYGTDPAEGQAPDLIRILQVDIGDLGENLTSYGRIGPWLIANQNLKYVLFDPQGRIVKSNLRLDESLMTSDRAIRNKKIEEAILSKKTGLSYTYGTKALELNGSAYRMKTEYVTELSRYDYIFEEGSRLLVCVLDENTSDQILGKYLQSDLYGKADAGYRAVSGRSRELLAVFTIALLLGIFSFLAFTVTVPRLEKEEVKGFHKVPTIIAAAIMFSLGMILMVIPAAILDQFSTLAGNVSDATELFLALCFICAALEIMAFLYGWYSLVLRLKSRTFLSNSLFAVLFVGKKGLLWRIFAAIFGALESLIEAVAGFFQRRGNVLIRSVLPFVIYLLINFILLLMVVGISPGLPILLGILFNIGVGAALYMEERSRQSISDGVERIIEGDLSYQIDVEKMFDGNKKLAGQVNQIGDGIARAVERSMKDERMKTELITNVSHDIKTPLTSVINYVDLLKRENLPGERAQEYLKVLDEKSQRLKTLIYDLVEASKISSGNVTLQMTNLDLRELLSQCLGEFEDRLEDRSLSVVYEKPEQPMEIQADSASMWRVLENLMGNVCKYAMPGSRVYVKMEKGDIGKVIMTMKNVSENPIRVSPLELTERFVRGDEARTSEGSGLGLSIARDLMRLMNGELTVETDADLFTITLLMKAAE